MKYFIFWAVLLTGCDALVEIDKKDNAARDQTAAESNAALLPQLPEGCVMTYLGDYRSRYSSFPVILIQCAATKTTTTTTSSLGKNPKHSVTFTQEKQ